MSAPEAMLEPRVIVQGFAQFRGEWPNLPIPKIFFSSPTSCALVSTAGAEDQLTRFTLILGELRVQLTEDMSFHPDLSEEKYSMSDVLVIEHTQGYSLQIKVMDDTQRAKWSRAVRNAIAETIFQDAFVQPVSALKLSKAVFSCSSMVPSANCHLLRARRLTETLLRLDKALKAVQQDPTDVPLAEIEELNRLCGSDPLLKDLQELKQLNRFAGLPSPQQQLEEQQARARAQLEQLRRSQSSPHHRSQRSSHSDILIVPSASQEFISIGGVDLSSSKSGRLSEAYYYRPRDSIRRGRRKREDIMAKSVMPKMLLYYLVGAAFFIVFGFGFLMLAPRLLALSSPSTALVPAAHQQQHQQQQQQQPTQYPYSYSYQHSHVQTVPRQQPALVAETRSTASAAGQQAKWAMAAIRKSHNEAILEAQAAAKTTHDTTVRRAGGFFGTTRGSVEPLGTLSGKQQKPVPPTSTRSDSRVQGPLSSKTGAYAPPGGCYTTPHAAHSRWWWVPRITPIHEWSLVKLLQRIFARIGRFVKACVGLSEDRVR